MSLYKFVKTTTTREGRGASPGRLFVEGHTQDQGVSSVEAVYTRRQLTSDYTDHAEESRHSARRPGGVRSVTTRVVRKTTTLTRGEERSVTESLLREGRQRVESLPLESSREYRAIQAKRAKVLDDSCLIHSFYRFRSSNSQLNAYYKIKVVSAIYRDGFGFGINPDLKIDKSFETTHNILNFLTLVRSFPFLKGQVGCNLA